MAFIVSFFARDPFGAGDTYWIKTYKNGSFLNKPQELNIAYDAAFDGGSASDGIVFHSSNPRIYKQNSRPRYRRQ